jgi:hypothetical protein
MLMDQNSRYRNAVGQSNVGSKLSAGEIPSVTQLYSKSSARISSSKASINGLKQISQDASSQMVAPNGPRTAGSSAGYRGGKSIHLQMNGGGYMGSLKKNHSAPMLGNVSGTGTFKAAAKSSFTNRATGRLAQNSKSLIKIIKALNRLV